jgi:hypothetical protein
MKTTNRRQILLSSGVVKTVGGIINALKEKVINITRIPAVMKYQFHKSVKPMLEISKGV